MQRTLHTIDATGKILGRLATEVAVLLMGKHKPGYAPHADGGDRVVIEHVSLLRFTEKKLDSKLYRHHTLHPGGLKTKTLREKFTTTPEKVFIHAVAKMLPKNKLRKEMLKRLDVKK